ncbi:MAG: aspartyl protease family protein [Alphaproteobacteria bacterium]|nr:aspartyl protease family protein [Alphaproteobacteria bacterium]
MRTYEGPESTSIDLIRVADDGPRIYVEAGFPDGSTGLFLVDTGADISVLSRERATALGLVVEEGYSELQGLSGVVPMNRAVLPQLRLGEAAVADIEVAVGVPGLGDVAGAMPLDGLLGNNVWSQFTVEIDYPADLMVLHAPGSLKPRRRAGTMYFNGRHVFAPIDLYTEADPREAHTVILKVDTGASELSICGRAASVFSSEFTEGLEAVYGIGASDTLPPFRNLTSTRRIPLAGVSLGGRYLDDVESARWLDFDNRGTCPGDMRGLAGHDLLAGHRVIFDYQGGRLDLAKSRRKPRQNNGHRLLLERDIARHGPDAPERGAFRARLRIHLDELDAARADLERFLDSDPDPEEARGARVLLANLFRHEGDLVDAAAVLEPLSPGQLVDEGEIVAAVNGLIFERRTDDALALAEEATAERSDQGWAWVSLADARLALGDTDGAHDALVEAVSLEQYPDAHLLRRARVALAAGDRHASHAHVRKLLSLYPMGGEVLWFYALLADDDATRATFARDLDAAMARLHPRTRPMDFLVAAKQVTGEHEIALAYMREGIQRDCSPLGEGPSADNCLAWYWSLAGVRQDEALERIERALASDGERSDFLDTKAMVHLARGEYEAARNAAIAAARLSPDNVYMLWQAERIADLAEEAP